MPAVVADPGSTPGRPNPPRSTPAGLLEGAGRIEGLSPPGASEGRPAGDAGTPDGGRVRPPPFDGLEVSPGFAGAGRMLGAAGVREGVPGLTRVGGRVSGVLGLSTLGRPVEGGIVGVVSLGRVGLVWIGRDGLGCEGLGLGATGRTSGRGAGEGGAAAGREGRSPCVGSVRGRRGGRPRRSRRLGRGLSVRWCHRLGSHGGRGPRRRRRRTGRRSGRPGRLGGGRTRATRSLPLLGPHPVHPARADEQRPNQTRAQRPPTNPKERVRPSFAVHCGSLSPRR